MLKTSRLFLLPIILLMAADLNAQNNMHAPDHFLYNMPNSWCDSLVTAISDDRSGFNYYYRVTDRTSGNLIDKITQFNSNKGTTHYIITTRDASNLITQADQLAGSTLMYRYLYAYDSIGRMIQKATQDTGLNDVQRENYYYDANSRHDSLVVEVKTGSNWKVIHIAEIEFDSSGDVLDVHTYNGSPIGLSTRSIYIYNNSKQVEEILSDEYDNGIWKPMAKHSYVYKTNGEKEAIELYNYINGSWSHAFTDSFYTPQDYDTWDYSLGSPVLDEKKRCYSRTVVGINAPVLDRSFSIYPNPANDLLNISATEEHLNGYIIVYDIAGRELLNKRVTSLHQQLDVSTLKAGSYFLRLSAASGDKAERVKFMKR